jgi:hypothetical protein
LKRKPRGRKGKEEVTKKNSFPPSLLYTIIILHFPSLPPS